MFRGAEQATLSQEVTRAIAQAEVIVIGPSNPIASIGPILAVPGLRDALAAADAPGPGSRSPTARSQPTTPGWWTGS